MLTAVKIQNDSTERGLEMGCEGEEKEERRRRGPSNHTLSWSGIIAVAGLLASGVATYNAVQNDIAALKRGEVYQERTNERLSAEIKSARVEQRETMKEFNEKLDRVIEHWSRRK
ncbi:hypothetical protein SAMN05216428_11410 [Nitrosospira sp. Nsp11]|uniref:hypothetical protein n=1 Tax=Nitrosospira sp. Nsp11 TaxID=1855338 RepID=UPI0009113256|nr:hypothetical protein [Nitrosospira sp. Nsp11]SHM10870.1 hypothetical protein SAMN05216428_11410 [Nitrosospira sp. Nsp11]